MKWLNSLKIAVIDKDITAIQNTINDMPKINEMAKAKEALALVKEAIMLVEEEKTKTEYRKTMGDAHEKQDKEYR